MTQAMLQPEPDIHDLVDQLTRTHSHREPYVVQQGPTRYVRGHITQVPALVRQLVGATPAGSGEETGGGSAKSRPAARIEALDTVMLIDDEASRWLRQLGENDPIDTVDGSPHGRYLADPGSGTIACIQQLHALHARITPCRRTSPARDKTGTWCCTHHHIEADVRRWWRQARVVSGWDAAAWRPDNSCPVCEQRRSLRVHVLAQLAVCVECRSTWGPERIGLLAEHIRTENLEDDGTEDSTEDTAPGTRLSHTA